MPIDVARRGDNPTEIRFDATADAAYRLRLRTSERSETAIIQSRWASLHDGFEIGDRVILGRHEDIGGSENFHPDMAKYVRCLARITELLPPVDSYGTWDARVDLRYAEEDGWVWRTRNLRIPGDGYEPPASCDDYSPRILVA